MTHRCCPEYAELSRRGFLATAGAAAAAVVAGGPIARLSLARSFNSAQQDAVVVIFLRGGADALSLCVPHGDPAYYAARPTLAVPPPARGGAGRAIDLDGYFGLPPSMQALHPAFLDDQLLVVHACGSTNTSRSHFVGQFNVESGVPVIGSVSTGWVGRHLSAVPAMIPGTQVRAAGIGFGGLQQCLSGAPDALGLPPVLSSFGLVGMFRDPANAITLRNMYTSAEEPLGSAATDALNAAGQITAVNFAGYRPVTGVTYPTSGIASTLRDVAALLKAGIGVEAVAIDSLAGWDTHADQGTTDGDMAEMMTTLSAALAAFHADTRDMTSPGVTTIVMSEFGRSLYENSSKGTDHGRAGAMLVLGRSVAGGRVLRQWPGLAPAQLEDGRDLRVTIDYRDVLAEILSRRLGAGNLGAVFPGYTPTIRGVIA